MKNNNKNYQNNCFTTMEELNKSFFPNKATIKKDKEETKKLLKKAWIFANNKYSK